MNRVSISKGRSLDLVEGVPAAPWMAEKGTSLHRSCGPQLPEKQKTTFWDPGKIRLMGKHAERVKALGASSQNGQHLGIDCQT